MYYRVAVSLDTNILFCTVMLCVVPWKVGRKLRFFVTQGESDQEGIFRPAALVVHSQQHTVPIVSPCAICMRSL